MANAVNWAAASSRTTGISAETVAAGANNLGDAINNDTNEDRWCALELTWTCASASTAWKTVEVYVLYSLDGTNYEDGDATPTDPYKAPAAVFSDDGGTGAQKQTKINIPLAPFKFKLLIKSELDQQATSLSLLCYTYNEEIQ